MFGLFSEKSLFCPIPFLLKKYTVQDTHEIVADDCSLPPSEKAWPPLSTLLWVTTITAVFSIILDGKLTLLSSPWIKSGTYESSNVPDLADRVNTICKITYIIGLYNVCVLQCLFELRSVSWCCVMGTMVLLAISGWKSVISDSGYGCEL